MHKQLKFLTLLLLIFSLFIVACTGGSEEEKTDDTTTTETEEETATKEEPADAGADDEPEAAAPEVDGSIWVLLPDSASSARWETDDRRFFEQAFDAAGVEYSIVNAEGDAQVQQSQAEQAITSGAAVILMVNLDSGSGAAIIETARDAGVKVIDYDRLTIEGPGADIYVSFDNVQVGATMGTVLEPMINAQDGTPKVVMLNGGPTDNNATLFREGYFSVAEPFVTAGEWAVAAEQAVPGWDNQEALVIMEQILTSIDNDVTAVFAANDGLAGATVTALENAGLDPSMIPISGQDATVAGIQNILAGKQAMTVYKPIKAEAEAAAEAAIALLNGTDLAELTGGLTLNNGTNDIPFLALEPIGVTKDKIASTVIEDGFRTWDEVCVGDFEAFCTDDVKAGMMAGDMGGMDDEPIDGSVWVLLPDSASSARWETDDRRFFEQAFEAAGVEYSIVNAEGDAQVQQNQAEQAITSGAAVILMVNLDSGSGASIIETARDAGVKVVDYDRLTVEGEGADVYVSFDNVQVGKTMGDVLEPMINAQDGTPQIVMLNGGPTDNNATLFREGYFGVAEPFVTAGDWELAYEQAVPGWDNQEALVIMEQALTAIDNNVTAVFAANDGLAGATVTALENAGLDPSMIPISGQDATVAGIQNILAGKQAMTVYKPIKAEAEAAADVAIALLKGTDLTELTGGLTLNNGTNDIPFLALDPIGVTKGNIATTVIEDGFRTWEEVCIGDFEAFCTDDVKSGMMADDDMAMDDHGGAMDWMGMMPDASGADGSVWVLLPDSASSARWETDDRRFFEQAFDAAEVEYQIVNAEGDAQQQQSQAEQAITSGAKVILMVNLDSGSGAAIIETARDADVKIIDYDRLTIEGEGADVYVSFDNVAVGATMGEVLEPMISAQEGTPQVVMLNGGPTDNNATLFREGYFGVAEPFVTAGDWEVAYEQAVPGWDNQEALVIMEQALTAIDNNVTAVFAANDGLAGATVTALENAGLDPTSIPISGQDATVAGIQNILAGKQAMTVYKPIKAEAEAAAVAAVRLLMGESIDDLTGGLTLNNGTNDVPFVALDPIGVTSENIADTVIADGFRTWDEVCVGDFEAFCPADR